MPVFWAIKSLAGSVLPNRCVLTNKRPYPNESTNQRKPPLKDFLVFAEKLFLIRIAREHSPGTPGAQCIQDSPIKTTNANDNLKKTDRNPFLLFHCRAAWRSLKKNRSQRPFAEFIEYPKDILKRCGSDENFVSTKNFSVSIFQEKIRKVWILWF